MNPCPCGYWNSLFKDCLCTPMQIHRYVSKISGPLLVMALVVGVGVSLFQAVTQVQEMSLTFVPKLIGMALVLVFMGNWMLRELVGWVTELWSSIPTMLG